MRSFRILAQRVHNRILPCCLTTSITRLPCGWFSSTSTLSPSLEERLQRTQERHAAILEEMSSAGHTAAALGKELSSLQRTVQLLQERAALDQERTALEELLAEVSSATADQQQQDDEMEQECRQELERIGQQRVALEERLIDSVLPIDPDDHGTDAIVEVRSGTGGDEASLFASELVDCYTKTAQALSWKVEVLSESRTDIGGVREVSLSVSLSHGRLYKIPVQDKELGDVNDSDDDDPRLLLGPFGAFRFESGGHRVQRVPVTDSSRIHTSACSVAVLPSMASDNRSNSDLLPLSELKIETMRSSGAGGQHVNTTDSAVRITHLPTKLTASIQDERSQHKNKEKAMKLIAARVRDLQKQQAEQERGETRSSLMGGGDRSERIRTYNFPQDRVTDHRSKESKFGIPTLLSGNVAESSTVLAFLPMLKALHRQEQLEELTREETE